MQKNAQRQVDFKMLNSLKRVISGEMSDAEVRENMRRRLMTPKERRYYETVVLPAEEAVSDMDYGNLMRLSRGEHPIKYKLASLVFPFRAECMIQAKKELLRRKQERDARRLSLGE
jgi:hypothetical protein